MKKILLLLLLPFLISFITCNQKQEDDLLQGFVDPPAEARPFVRWWWPGNRITEDEIIRQLDVLHSAGIGGVEINPIAFPEWCDPAGTESLTWLSPEWNRLLARASEEAAGRGMITDLIVGSGWPFGGEFLNNEEIIQRIITNSIPCSGGDQINETPGSLLEKALAVQSRAPEGESFSNNIMFLFLVPDSLGGTTDITDLSGELKADNSLSYTVPEGNYNIVYGILEKGHRHVQNGSPGAAGPVMDHYKKEVTIAYLNRLKKISDDTGIPLNRLIRALFCDSIELAGSNWTDGFDEKFRQTYGYDLIPWLPFIFYEPYRGYTKVKGSPDFSDKVSRVRYDYNSLLVRVFLDNFTKTFQEFCTANGLLCRYQAYGTPFLMGMMEGNMIPDIPESNNWLYSVNMDSDEWIWNQDHGYMIWNLYAASGGHLKGRKIISCESMTNTRGVFKTSLEEVKRHDDMNFITGINHTILHGYNYSPTEAGFPGWIRFGAYFSEQNTWWPWFSRWTEYNARLSYIFQHSQAVKNIAIMGPTGDVWSERGLIRVPFHKEPWYCYRLWEPLSQAGSSCDYIDESIIVSASKDKGLLKYGPMSYQALFLCGIKSIEAETALALQDFVSNGGRLVIIDGSPVRSLSFNNAEINDKTVIEIFSGLVEKYPERVTEINSPASPDVLLSWTTELLDKIKIKKDVIINNPDKNIFQIRQVYKHKDIYFFVNSNRTKTVKFNALFPDQDKIPWIWNPENGTRNIFPFGDRENDLTIELNPLESMLLVFEPRTERGPQQAADRSTDVAVMTLTGPWRAEFQHVNGQNLTRNFEELKEFGTSEDADLSSFAGTVKYFTTFESDGSGRWLSLERVNKGVTEVYLNGKNAGSCWYGKPTFLIDTLLQKGENKLEIRYTSILSNYVRTMKDSPTAIRWTPAYDKLPSGLDGDVIIYR